MIWNFVSTPNIMNDREERIAQVQLGWGEDWFGFDLPVRQIDETFNHEKRPEYKENLDSHCSGWGMSDPQLKFETLEDAEFCLEPPARITRNPGKVTVFQFTKPQRTRSKRKRYIEAETEEGLEAGADARTEADVLLCDIQAELDATREELAELQITIECLSVKLRKLSKK